MNDHPKPPEWVVAALREGQVIPAHPLALTEQRKLDVVRQRALTRYYHESGAGGIAVGVHTTQFAIRDAAHGMLGEVLQIAAETAAACDVASGRKTILVAGVCGPAPQAIAEARQAQKLGYHAALLSLGALKGANDDELLDHCGRIAREIPLFGFYLQPAAGGRLLSPSFWRRFVEIPNVIGIKIAPFNRYQTLDVLRAVAESGSSDEIALYTGNDDNIVNDLITEFAVPTGVGVARLRFNGGLLGHWACWTRRAVELLEECKRHRAGASIPSSLLTLGAQITDCNAAIFDAATGFSGCIPGIHEILRRQGLLAGVLCLDPSEALSPGQSQEIDRIYRCYPHLNDDEFVRERLDNWLK